MTKVIGRVHEFFRRHCQKALQIRQKIRFSEEAFHLVLAGGVGVIGGLVNLLFYHSIEWVKHLIDYGSRAGGGMQVVVAPLNGQPYPDVVAGGKSGLFLFRRAGLKAGRK